jgi:hypothetical protein
VPADRKLKRVSARRLKKISKLVETETGIVPHTILPRG